MSNTEALNFPVSPELKARIRAYARLKGISQADAGRLLLDAALTREGIPHPPAEESKP
jgi:hypothetical protein